MSYTIEKLHIDDYEKCNNIWNMKDDPFTKKFRAEIESGNREVFIYKVNNEFLGEIAVVYNMNDPDYTIKNKRVYLSRLIVRPEHRNKGIGSILVDYAIDKIKQKGYSEISIGVDKQNVIALHLYQKKGFTNIVFDGSDEHGEYYKLLKII